MDKFIDAIDRILWNTQMASLTSPTLWGRCTSCGETTPWITVGRNDEANCTRCAENELHHAGA